MVNNKVYFSYCLYKERKNCIIYTIDYTFLDNMNNKLVPDLIGKYFVCT